MNRFRTRGVGNRLALLSINRMMHSETWTEKDEEEYQRLVDVEHEHEYEKEEDWWEGEENDSTLTDPNDN